MALEEYRRKRDSMEEIAQGKAAVKQAAAGTRGDGLNKLVRRYPGVQLATLVDHPPEGAEWLHEIKFCGYRLVGFVSGGETRLMTRNGKDWTSKFPSLTGALVKLTVKDAVLDMEAVVLDAEGKSSLQKLQEALGDGGDPEKIIAHAFDLPHLRGAGLTLLPLIPTKSKLRSLLGCPA